MRTFLDEIFFYIVKFDNESIALLLMRVLIKEFSIFYVRYMQLQGGHGPLISLKSLLSPALEEVLKIAPEKHKSL